MITVTLDTDNCLIALERNEPAAKDIWQLIHWHNERKIDVKLSGSAGLERTLDKSKQSHFRNFQRRLDMKGIGHIKSLPVIWRLGVTFLGKSKLCDDDMLNLEEQIQDTLLGKRKRREGRNIECDTWALWSHINQRRDIFVTNDSDFYTSGNKPKEKLLELGAGEILKPHEAVKKIEQLLAPSEE